MKKKRRYIFIIIILIIIYAALLFLEHKYQDNGKDPVIQVPESTLKVSVKAKEKTLLKGVKAIDEEDGDISSQVYIESISPFQSDQTRTITYAVLDSDDNMTRATRKLKYKDYKKPTITLTQALCMNYIESTNSLKDYVSAKSSVDGNISSKISVDKTDYSGDDYYVTYSVTDSCGVKTSLKAKVSILSNPSDIKISLSDYLIRVKKGKEINPRKYIDTIEVMGVEDDSLRYNVKITNNYDASKEGTYEFIYRLENNGETGITKLVVIVEGDENE